MKFLGASYTRTDIDLMDKGAVRAAVYRYVETGNADELAAFLNQPWAKTSTGQSMIEEMLKEARERVASQKTKAKKAKDNEENDLNSWSKWV